MANDLRVLTFCWNTQSLRIGKPPEEEIKLDDFEEISEAEFKAGGQEVEQMREQVSSSSSSSSYWGLGYLGDIVSSSASAVMGAGSAVVDAGQSVVDKTYDVANASARYIYGELLNAEFVIELVNIIHQRRPDVVVISLEESAKPGDYLMSHIFPDIFMRNGYALQYRTRFMGAGVSTIKTYQERGLRLGVFLRVGLRLEDEEPVSKIFSHYKYFNENSYNCSSALTRSKGGLCIYMNFPSGKRLAFIGVHFPHNAKSLIEYRLNDSSSYQDRIQRQDSISDINKCFNRIAMELILDVKPPVHGAIVMGDFNYRIQASGAMLFTRYMMSPEFNPRWVYETLDEFKMQLDKQLVYEWREGVQNRGPGFRPTCKMSQGRDYLSCGTAVVKVPGKKGKNWFRKEENPPKYENMANRKGRLEMDRSDFRYEDCYNLGKYDQRIPSWCDRIVYKTLNREGKEIGINCILYDRFDYSGTFSMSDHTGVLAIFNVQV